MFTSTYLMIYEASSPKWDSREFSLGNLQLSLYLLFQRSNSIGHARQAELRLNVDLLIPPSAASFDKFEKTVADRTSTCGHIQRLDTALAGRVRGAIAR